VRTDSTIFDEISHGMALGANLSTRTLASELLCCDCTCPDLSAQNSGTFKVQMLVIKADDITAIKKY
jgi:hypothetical protein